MSIDVSLAKRNEGVQYPFEENLSLGTIPYEMGDIHTIGETAVEGTAMGADGKILLNGSKLCCCHRYVTAVRNRLNVNTDLISLNFSQMVSRRKIQMIIRFSPSGSIWRKWCRIVSCCNCQRSICAWKHAGDCVRSVGSTAIMPIAIATLKLVVLSVF